MAKQNLVSEKHNFQKIRTRPGSSANIQLSGYPDHANAIGGDGAMQAVRLGDTHLPENQRRSLAARIGQVQGNQHLQRAIASPPVQTNQSSPVIQRDPLPRADLGPRSRGRAYMLDWDSVHREINQSRTLREAFQANLSRYLESLFGESITSDQVLQRIARFEAEGNPAEAARARTNLSIANQYAVVDTLDVEHSARYQRQGSKTYCNIYGYDVVTALGGYIPRVWWTDAAIRRIRDGETVRPVYGDTVHELNANALTNWMHTYGGEFGWSQSADINAAQEAANTGALVVLLAAQTPHPTTGRSRPGHINIIMPEMGEHQAVREGGVVVRPLQSQAGGTNFRVEPHRSRWWEGRNYTGGGAWIYQGAPSSPLLTPEEIGGQPAAGGREAPAQGGTAAGAAAPETAPASAAPGAAAPGAASPGAAASESTPTAREEEARTEASEREAGTTGGGTATTIQMPEMVIVGDPQFYSRAERLNRHYAANPPSSGWPYDDSLRAIWGTGNYDDFADRVREIQERAGMTGRAVDGILGPATARVLQPTAVEPPSTARGGETTTTGPAATTPPAATSAPAATSRPSEATEPSPTTAPAATSAPTASSAFPGRVIRRGGRDRGYAYGGESSRAFVTRRVNQEAERFASENFPQKATACRVFLELAPMEGWLSAINTWDNKKFTWGAGFAFNGMLNTMWEVLDDSVKSYLASDPHAGQYFTSSGMNITDQIRMDTEALNAVVYVSEADPYRELVLQAQLQTFMRHTMAIAENPTPGENFAVQDISLLSLAAHLEHWLPAFFRMPGDLEDALELSGGTREQITDLAATAIALTRLHAHRMLNHNAWSEDGPDGRRVLKANKLGFQVISHYSSNLRKLFDTRRTPLTITSQATGLVPAFTQGNDPFFTAVTRLEDIPGHHYALREGRNHYYDFGERS